MLIQWFFLGSSGASLPEAIMLEGYQVGDSPILGYTLERFLGRGGFGEVWRAIAPGETRVAMKIIPLQQQQGLREWNAIQLVKTLRHPNLVPLLAFWLRDLSGKVIDQTTDPTQEAVELILAMGLGDRSLEDQLKTCQQQGLFGIPPADLVQYLEDAARAIDFLNAEQHNPGESVAAVQHCDIKPQNLLLVGGAVQVCDFGLAQALVEKPAEKAAGSPAYAAPECIREGRPSQWTDQYSLAITYVELRTGQLPFAKRSRQAAMEAHLHGKLNFSKLSQAEQEVICKATSMDPQKRYPNAVSFIRQLRDIFDPEAMLSQRVSQPMSESDARQTSLAQLKPGTALIPGYRLIRELFRDGSDEVWEGSAPGGKRVALLVRNLLGTPVRLDPRALALVQRMEHPYLTESHACWRLDAFDQVIPDQFAEQSTHQKPARLVIVGKLANQTLLGRLEECQKEGEMGIPLKELLGYMEQMAEAINFLNTPQHYLAGKPYSVIHCAIHPGNMLLYSQQVRLGNFSVAQTLRGEADVALPTIACLSEATQENLWIAPELRHGRVSLWSDQYALAMSYIYLRTGKIPVSETETNVASKDSLRDKLAKRFSLPKIEGLSKAEEKIIRQATTDNPWDRYPDAISFVKELARVTESIKVASPSAFSKLGAGKKRVRKWGEKKKIGRDEQPTPMVATAIPKPEEIAVTEDSPSLAMQETSVPSPQDDTKAVRKLKQKEQDFVPSTILAEAAPELMQSETVTIERSEEVSTLWQGMGYRDRWMQAILAVTLLVIIALSAAAGWYLL
ncbi:Hypothetical protein PBC10988_0280 [Planctomycetales bacterium 10988]|nr:Hypothetical protein PBC10988_0280 [Planctomycetales bacterium 10988]